MVWSAKAAMSSSPVRWVGVWHDAQPICSNSSHPARTSASSAPRMAGTARVRV